MCEKWDNGMGTFNILGSMYKTSMYHASKMCLLREKPSILEQPVKWDELEQVGTDASLPPKKSFPSQE